MQIFVISLQYQESIITNLLGIRESYIPHSDGKLEHEQIDNLRDSLILVQDEINNKCPLIVPGRYNRISDLLYS